MNMINLTSISTASLVLPQLYRDFQLIHQLLAKFFLSYIFIIGSVGLVTNAVTVVLLSKSLITKNLKNRWTLIALGMSAFFVR